MTTLAPTQARVNLSSLLRRAPEGDDIVIGGRVVALRPTEILSSDYARREYGLSPAEMKAVANKLHTKAKKARLAGKSKIFRGDIEALLKE